MHHLLEMRVRFYKRDDETAHLPHAVGEQEAYIVAHFPEQWQRLLVILLRLAAETADEVAAQTDPWVKKTVRIYSRYKL